MKIELRRRAHIYLCPAVTSFTHEIAFLSTTGNIPRIPIQKPLSYKNNRMK